MGSSDTPSSSSACRTDQETSGQKEPNRSCTSGNFEAFLLSSFKPKPKPKTKPKPKPKPKPKLPHGSDEVAWLTRSIDEDMEYISRASEKIKDYEDEIPELKRAFNELLSRVKNTTSDDDQPVVSLANDLWDLHKKVTNLKEGMTAKDSEAEALKNMIHADQDFVKEVSEKIKKSKEDRLDNLEKYVGTVVELRDLKRKVTKEKQRIMTSKQKDESKEEEEEEEDEEKEEESELTHYVQSRSHVTGTGTIKGGHAALEKMPNLSKSSSFAESSMFKDFEARYHELGMELKQCLLCFSIFPENAEIKKRVMTYWWIGEGFVPPLGSEVSKKQQNNNSSSSSSKTPEDYANDFFYELIAKDFIEPSSKLSSPGLASLTGVKTCKMNPFVRSMVIMLAKGANFFDFDDDMNVTSNYISSGRACLTSGKRLEFNTKHLQLLCTLFNVNEAVLQFNPELFRWMKYAKVLYLGSWKTSSENDVDFVTSKSMSARDLNVLEGLGHVKHLRFLSFQRMSRMRSIPATISKLECLTVLDIRACQNLEKIPDEIGSLVKLTHLDMSECYLLDHMPKGLSKLINLQVLGGFVVGESDDSAPSTSCTLADLRSMIKLRKLSIDTGVEEFPSPDQLCHLNKLEMLHKLTIAWGTRYATKSSPTIDKARTTSNYKSKEKLTCFPWLKAPNYPWDKRNASPKVEETPRDNSSPELPVAEEVGKENSVLEPPEDKAGKNNSAPESPPVEEIGKDISASKPPLVEEIGKDNSALEPPPVVAEEAEKDSSAPEPPPAVKERKKGIHGRHQSKAKLLPDAVMHGQSEAKLPLNLEKLDLQCFPNNKKTNKDWLKSENLPSLKKLYIRGGKCFDLSGGDEVKGTNQNDLKGWKVEVLRLRYLANLKMEWKELQRLFPNLRYLQTVNCPNLSFFPCDPRNGVWMKQSL